MRLRDGVSVGCGLAAIAVAVFALGGVDRWAQTVVAVLIAMALIPQLRSRRVLDRVSPLVAMIAIAAILTALQLLPLPNAWIEWLNPTGAALRDDGAKLLELSPWRALSLDAPGTLRALAFFVILLGVAVLTLRASVSERGRYRVMATVAIVCALAAAVVGVHQLFGIRALYGLYAPREARPAVLGPLLNQNNLGCLMALGTVVAIGLVLYRRQSSTVRAAWLLVVCGCGATAVASQSRGAALALVAGSLVTIGTRLAQRFASRETGRERSAISLRALPLTLVAVCTVVVIVYASAGGVADRWSRTTADELGRTKSVFVAWHSATQLIEESPWVGVGRGALEPAFTRVHPASRFSTYAYVENEYVQAVTDWGIPGAIALGLATFWLVATAIRRWRDGPLAAGALGALAVVMIQSNVDFGVELLGIAIPITAVAATLAYVPLVEAKPRALLVRRLLRGGHVIALGVAAWLLMASVTTSVAEDHAQLTALAHPTIDDVRPALTRHPLDYFGYALASEIFERDGDKRAIQMLNHALILHPTHAGLHLYTARLLRGTGHLDQAAIEYASAMRGTAEPAKLIAEIVASFPPALAARAIPTDYDRIDEVVRILDDSAHHDLAFLWLGRLLDQAPTMHVCELMYAVIVEHESRAAIETTRQRCPDYEPTHETRAELAKFLVDEHGGAAAIQMIGDVETWDGLIDLKHAAWLTLCDAHVSLAHWDDARHCLHSLDASGVIDDAHAGEIRTRLNAITVAQAAADLKSPAPPQPTKK